MAKRSVTFVLFLLTVCITRGGASDFDVFCSLVSLNNLNSWCTNCGSPCGNCGVTCNTGKTRITQIEIKNKGFTALPESIGSLTELLWL